MSPYAYMQQNRQILYMMQSIKTHEETHNDANIGTFEEAYIKYTAEDNAVYKHHDHIFTKTRGRFAPNQTRFKNNPYPDS